MRRMFVMLLPLALAGCVWSFGGDEAAQNVPLNPLTIDPTEVAVRVGLPEGAASVAGTAILGVAARNLGTGAISDEAYILDADEGVFRIAAEDVPRLLAQQDLLREWDAGPGIEGQLVADMQSCAIGSGPAPGAMMNVSMQMTPGAPFVPLASAPLVTSDGGGALPPC